MFLTRSGWCVPAGTVAVASQGPDVPPELQPQPSQPACLPVPTLPACGQRGCSLQLGGITAD